MFACLLLAGIRPNLAAFLPSHLAIWCGLVVSSVVLVALFRSRWGRRSPLFRCAVGSLLVHMLIVALTMTVRLVVGDGGAGAGPPIYVKLVDDIQHEGPITLDAPPDLLAAEETTNPESEAAPSPAVDEAVEDMAAVEAPPLIEQPEPVVEEKVVEKTVEKQIVIDESAETPAPDLAEAGPSIPDPVTPVESEPNEVAAAESAPPAAITEVAATVPPATSPYAHRNAPDRLQYAERHGGSMETEAAVAAALKWLAERQSSDGRWDADRHGAGIERAVLGQDRGGAGADADSGITALALLAFLGAGHSHLQGDYQSTVAHGLEYLMRGQASDGHLAANTSLYARMYCHSMASFALAEALAMTRDERLAPAVERAVQYSLRAQHPSTGGWRYRPGDTGDTSQLGWQLMALWSAEQAGVAIPPRTWTGAERFLRSVERGRMGGLASYRPDGPASTPMTAEAMYCRLVVANALGGRVNRPAGDEATAAILAAPPEPERVNLYYWYYATLALHHQQQQSPEGAKAWQTWNTALAHALVQSQLDDGPEAGSWEPNCIWGGYGGRVYSTAISAMCLEVYYRYTDDSSTNGWTASRQETVLSPR